MKMVAGMMGGAVALCYAEKFLSAEVFAKYACTGQIAPTPNAALLLPRLLLPVPLCNSLLEIIGNA